jgi:hypothetical protein
MINLTVLVIMIHGAYFYYIKSKNKILFAIGPQL